MSDTQQQDLVERFGRLDDPLRVLLCSDVASEGLNLHYFCHRLVHFDLPWSLMVFQQRNGRVDRYGQKHQPHIVYLFTETVNERIKGDLRILEILEKKDEQANFNLGDPSAFLNVYDPDKEAEKVTAFMADGLSPEQVEATLDKAAALHRRQRSRFLMQLFGRVGTERATPRQRPVPAPASSTSHIDRTRVAVQERLPVRQDLALKQLNQGQTLCQWVAHDAEQHHRMTAPADLQDRLRQLPREVQADNDHYSLCADPTAWPRH
jgi:superfamily II DNA/RNA helicase